MKDLRDTYAIHLLTRGVNPAYVSRQLGHADWSVTAHHYARWTGGDQYVEPERLRPGEVPATYWRGWALGREQCLGTCPR